MNTTQNDRKTVILSGWQKRKIFPETLHFLLFPNTWEAHIQVYSSRTPRLTDFHVVLFTYYLQFSEASDRFETVHNEQFAIPWWCQILLPLCYDRSSGLGVALLCGAQLPKFVPLNDSETFLLVSSELPRNIKNARMLRVLQRPAVQTRIYVLILGP